MRKYYPQPKSCMDCGMITAKLDLACVTGIYDRDFKNYRYICRPCHTKIDNHKHFKDMSNRICSSCKTNETYIRRDGTMSWNHVDGELLCGRCYNRCRRASRKSMDDNLLLKSFIPEWNPTTVYRLQKNNNYDNQKRVTKTGKNKKMETP